MSIERDVDIVFRKVGDEAAQKALEATDRQLQGLEKRAAAVSKGLQASNKARTRADDIDTQVAQRNAERRAQLIEDETRRRERLLELRRQKELALAQRRGESTQLVEQLYQRRSVEVQTAADAARARAAERNARQREAAELRTLKLRARLIEDANARELALMEVRHRTEIARARRAGADLNALVAAQLSERQRLEERFAQAAQLASARAAQEAARAQDAASTSGKRLAGVLGEIGSAAKGTVAAYAGIAGIRMLLQMGREGGELIAIDRAAKAAGISSEYLSRVVKNLGGGSVDTAKKLVLLGDTFQIPREALEEFASIARASQQRVGGSVNDLYNDIVRGTARQSSAILDNLGIQVKVGQAQEDYARKLGKSASALTDVEKKQAFLNAVLSEGRRIVAATPFDAYTASIRAADSALEELHNNFKRFIAEDLLRPVGEALTGKFVEEPISRLEQARRQFNELAARSQAIAGGGEIDAETARLAGVDPASLVNKRQRVRVGGRLDFVPETNDATAQDQARVKVVEALRRETAAAAAEVSRLAEQELAVQKTREKAAAEAKKAADEAERAQTARANSDRTADARRRLLAELDQRESAQQFGGEDQRLVEQRARALDELRAAREAFLPAAAIRRLQDVQAAERTQLVRDIVAEDQRSFDEMTAFFENARQEREQRARAVAERDAQRQAEVISDPIERERQQRLASLEVEWQRARELAETEGDNILVLTAAFEAQRTRIVTEAAEKRREALLAEAAAVIDNVSRLGQAALSIARSTGASRGVIAGIERVLEIANAAKEVAAGIGAIARGDGLGAGVHFASAAAHGVAAAKFGRVPGAGGGGGGAETPSLPSGASTPQASVGGARGEQRVINNTLIINAPLLDQRSVRQAVGDANGGSGYGESFSGAA